MEAAVFPRRTIRKRVSKKRVSPGQDSRAKMVQRGRVVVNKASSELKGWTAALDRTFTGNTWDVVSVMHNIRLGNDDDDRVGKKVELSSIRWKGSSTPASAAVGPRFVIVYDRSPNGVAATAADIFDNTATQTIDELPNFRNSSRFVICRDYQVNLESPQGGEHTRISFDLYVPLKGLITRYLSNLGTVADVQEGQILLLSTGFATDDTMDSVYRVRYRDL